MGRDKLKAFYERQKSDREAMLASAAALIATGDHDGADRLVQAADPSIQGAVALARLYQARLESLVASGAVRTDRALVERVFRRALDWARSCYPEPHTQFEADDYRAGRAEDLGRLVKILGYDPTPESR